MQLQREFRRRNLLGTDAIKRLEAIGFRWEPEVGSIGLLPCSYLVCVCVCVCHQALQSYRLQMQHRVGLTMLHCVIATQQM